MKAIVHFLNLLKSNFKLLLVLFVLVLSFVLVQHVGHYTSFIWKYGTGCLLSLPLLLGWYVAEKKLQAQVNSDHQRSILWILVFGVGIVWGFYHIFMQEQQYQYHFPMCDCPLDAHKSDRVGAICEDGFKSYSTGRGTCSEHHGVAQWQCACD